MATGLADGVTGGLAIGGVYTNQDIAGGGDFNVKGFYVSPEVTAHVGGNFYVTLDGYYFGDRIDMHRGYLNTVTTNFSNGETDARTFGGKLRLDCWTPSHYRRYGHHALSRPGACQH